jgi:hypothetical protein
MKAISVYGAFETYEPVYQRYWKWAYHRKGPKIGEKWYKRRVWKKTTRLKKVVRTDGRFEIYGQGMDLQRAMHLIKTRNWVPFDYIEVEAKEFLEHPERYGERGQWVDWRVVS